MTDSVPHSYGQILRATSIIGGANVLNYLVGFIRIKIIAVLLGPAGVGLISLYSSAIALIGTVSSLGIGSSGVREVARAYSAGDPTEAARTVRILRRMCWATGVLGWLLAVVLAHPVSDWVFGSSEHATAIALLGATLLLGAVSAGQRAVLQGMRRIGDLARITVATALLSTGVTIALYAWLKQEGILPVLLATALVSLGVSWWYARQITVAPVPLNWSATMAGTRRLAGLGLAFMWSGLLTSGLDIATRTIITREYGVDAAGFYQAAWSLSGVFAGFVLAAMATDFYPRLTSVIQDHPRAVRLVNEQTEIGVLLALPGLLAMLALGPAIITIAYSERFLPGAELLPWFLLGVFGRVISWPLAFIQLAKGSARWFAITETVFIGLQLAFVYVLVQRLGLVGAAYAFAITYAFYTAAMLSVGKILLDFGWSPEVKKLLLNSGLLVLAAFIVGQTMRGWPGIVVGVALTVAGGLASLRGLSDRLGCNYPVLKSLAQTRAGRWIMGVGRN